MSLAIRPTLIRIPLLNIEFELSARDKKVMAVALASLLLFGLQLGLSLSMTLAITFLTTVLTYLSEKYIRTEPQQQNDWFNTDFNKKQMTFLVVFLLLRPLIIQIVCLAFGIPLPFVPQVELVQMLLSRPWVMIPIATIIAPIGEEILFRGFLLERLEDVTHLLNRHKICSLSATAQQEISNIAQAIIFGAIHLRKKIQEGWKFPVFFVLSVIGWGFGEFKRKDRTLLSPMAIHSANNASAVIHVFATQR